MMQDLKRGSGGKSKMSGEPAMLKEGKEEGVMVTRADGSKALKVKSRKRRSSQPKKEKERKNTRNKVILVSSGIFLVIMMGIAFIITLAYYNGQKFNDKLVTTAQSSSGAEVEIRGLNVSPVNAKMMQMSFDWGASNSAVDYLKVSGINTRYGVFSFLGGGWNGPEVLADSGEVKLYMLDNPEQISLSGETPVNFDFSTYKCNKLNAIIGREKDWLVNNTQAEYSINADGAKQVYFYGGKLKAPIFDDYNIKSGVLEIKQTFADLSVIIQPEDEVGSITLAGEVGYKSGSKISLATKFVDARMNGWVDDKTHRFINGMINNGQGFFKMNLGDVESKEILTHVESDEISISTFAFIETLSLEMKDSFYSRPVFTNNSKFSMNWLADKVVFSDIKLVETSHMQLKGRFEVLKTGDIKGRLKIGIPIESLSPVEVRRLKKIFKEDDGDLLWTDVNVGGTLASPTDDLAEQFRRAKSKSPEDAFDQFNKELSE